MKYVLSLLIVFAVFSFNYKTSLARITPEDIVNQKIEVYNQRVTKYSLANRQKLEVFRNKIAFFNKEKTDLLDQNMQFQAQILEEFLRRNPTLNESKQVENARYWLTYAHEAVAYQAAKIYIFNLSSERNLNSDISSTISILESELNTLRGKVIKSQKILLELVTSAP